jgi:hypothetical protein
VRGFGFVSDSFARALFASMRAATLRVHQTSPKVTMNDSARIHPSSGLSPASLSAESAGCGGQATFVEPMPRCGALWLDELLRLRAHDPGKQDAGATAAVDRRPVASAAGRTASDAPVFRVAHDVRGHCYFDFSQTCEMTTYLAQRVRTPDRLVSACGAKTQLWALELRQAGVSCAALRVAAMFVPDVSPQGLEHAHTRGEIMSAPSRFADIPFAERLRRSKALGAHDGDSAEGFRIGQFEFEFSRMDDDRPAVRIGSEWGIPQSGESRYSNHFALAVMTRHPVRGDIEPMVIDLAHDRTRPLSLTEWKNAQRYAGSVIATAAFSEPLRIDVRTLGAAQRVRLSSLLDAADADDAALQQIVVRLPEPERYRLMMDFLHAAPSRQVPEIPFRGEPYYGHYAATLSSFIEAPMWPAVAALRNRLAMQMMATRIARRIEPLNVYEQWLAATEPR